MLPRGGTLMLRTVNLPDVGAVLTEPVFELGQKPTFYLSCSSSYFRDFNLLKSAYNVAVFVKTCGSEALMVSPNDKIPAIIHLIPFC